ncbi:hypothetical protein HDU91_003992 [Kappamyces sp. JEL0680]|nr:hypothetical protein HDU91_003992 [Kappamyces sp. JEL0680]
MTIITDTLFSPVSESQETIPNRASDTSSSDKQESQDHSQDAIITELLRNRPAMTDVNEEFEKERQRRMYNMLRHSNHYKRLQVQFANHIWSEDGSAVKSSRENALAGETMGGLLSSEDLDEANKSASSIVASQSYPIIPSSAIRLSPIESSYLPKSLASIPRIPDREPEKKAVRFASQCTYIPALHSSNGCSSLEDVAGPVLEDALAFRKAIPKDGSVPIPLNRMQKLMKTIKHKLLTVLPRS